ncbi:MAG: RNHCP domain-containing protein [Chloroflexi bacterium]|nr:RNHCP domain-containing protein [Chloroflexota bacterium]
MSKSFQRTREDFICENCGHRVEGSGYTNHCPACLWSKHVDINPGDREELCGGMMEPVRVEGHSGEFRLVHRCVECGIEKRNKTAENDDFEIVLRIAADQGREV